MAKTRRKKRRTHVAEDVDASIPRTFVMKRGKVGRSVQQLMLDFRRIMEPNTASNLRVRKRNVLKDFVHVAGQIGISHFCIFSRTEVGPNLRIARLPRGPTLSFKIQEYAVIKDIITLQKKPRIAEALFQDAPLLVLNNFGGEARHLKLMQTVIQNMFPSINIHDVKLANIRRVLLMTYDTETEEIELRHYTISVQPTGLSKSIKRLVVHSKIPDLRDVDDISEYVLKGAYGSDSEGEDGAASHVTIPQKVGKLAKSTQTALKLAEIGPRLTLKLVKIEDGMCAGEVLHHSHISRTEEQMALQKKKRRASANLKAKRRKEQEENVKRKQVEALEHKKRTGKQDDELNSDVEADVELYRQEVGEEPDADMFDRKKRRRPRAEGEANPNFKKRRSLPDGKPDGKKGGKGVKFAKSTKAGKRDDDGGKSSASNGKGVKFDKRKPTAAGSVYKKRAKK